jgi:hypothetical protein
VSVGVVLAAAGTAWLWPRPSRPHSCQPRVKQDLKAIFTSQRAYLGEYDQYSEQVGRIGFAPELGNDYTYFLAPEGPVLDAAARRRPRAAAAPIEAGHAIIGSDPEAPHFRGAWTTFAATNCPLTPATLPDGRAVGLGVTRWGPRYDETLFIAAAAAQLDDDATVDCWSIASVERTARDGTQIPAGQPWLELNDLDR